MSRRIRNGPRPVSLLARFHSSPVLLPARPPSVCETTASTTATQNVNEGTTTTTQSVSVSSSLFSWGSPDSNGNASSGYDSTLECCEEMEITELSSSPTNHKRKVFSLSSPCPSPTPSSKHSSDFSSRPQSPSPASTPTHEQLGGSPSSSLYSSLRKFRHRVRGPNSFSASTLDCSAFNGDRRYMVISELIDTERKYISNLETLLNMFLPALEHAVSPRDLRLMFPAQLEPLVERHRELLSQLEERMGTNSQFAGIIGDIFARLLVGNSEFLNVYSAYLNEFKVAMTTLAKYEQNSDQFRELLHHCQQSPACEGLRLASYLLTPVQRLPRYELLLKELLKHTPMEHPDNYYVGDSIDRIREELIRLNQSIKSCQVACSVRKVGSRKSSFRFVRRNSRIISAKLKRHVSTPSIDDYSSGDSGACSDAPRLPRKPVLLFNKLPMYCSEENLKSSLFRSVEDLQVNSAGEEEEEERGYEEEGAGSYGRRGRHRDLSNMKAVSCSDLLIDFDHGERRRPYNMLTTLESIPCSPEPPQRPLTPSSTTHPLPSESCSTRPRSRSSVYSTSASSTSGIGSLNQSQLDLTGGSITPTELNPRPQRTSTPMGTPLSYIATVQHHVTPVTKVTERRRNSELDVKSAAAVKRKPSWAAAFRMIGKRKNSRHYGSTGQVLDISSPMDFKHIQHGFIAVDITPTNSTQLAECTSTTTDTPS